MKRLRTLVLALGLVTAVSSSGCGLSFQNTIADIRSGIDVAQMVITAISTFGSSYFNAHPNATDQAKFQAAVADAQAAAAGALSAANGASDVQSGDVAQAFTAFEDAYSSLLALAQSLGVKVSATSARAGAEVQSGVLVVPPPAKLIPKAIKVAPAATVSLRSAGAATLPVAPADRPTPLLALSSSTLPGEMYWAPGHAKGSGILQADGWVRIRGGALFRCPGGVDSYDCVLVTVR